MRIIIFSVSLCMFGMFLSIQDAQSFTLKQGAVSLSGSSNFMYQYTSNNRYNSGFSLAVLPGYFALDNLEIAVQLSGYYNNQYGDASAAVTPLFIYHIPLGESSNFFAGAGGGYSWRQHRQSGINLAALLGWEYFFTNQVAFLFKTQYSYFSFEHGYYKRYAEVTSQLGLALYFE